MAVPGTMLRTTWAQVDATSLTDFSRVLTDNITSNQVVLWMLGQLGGIVTRQGKTIFEPIMLDDAASAKWYSGYDPLDMTRTEVATGAEYAFKQLAGVEQISGFEKFQNSGPGQIIDLWDAMGQRLAITMKRKVNQALPADGSADGGKALIGYQSGLPFDPQTGVYGTLDRALNPTWRNQYFGGGGVGQFGIGTGTAAGVANINDATVVGNSTQGVINLFSGLRGMIVACMAGSDSPHLVVMVRQAYLKLLDGLEQKQQIVRGPDSTDAALGQAGFKNVVYMGVPHVWDEDMLPNTSVVVGSVSNTAGFGCVALNLDYAKMVFGEGYEFTFTDPIQPDNQDSASIKCLMYGNVVFSNLRRQARANFAGA
jgi:hypothetical protein